MQLRPFAGLIALSLTLVACALPGKARDSAAVPCAQCGVIQSINSRSFASSGPAAQKPEVTAYELVVRMDAGNLRQVTVATAEGLREGDRVELEARRVTVL